MKDIRNQDSRIYLPLTRQTNKQTNKHTQKQTHSYSAIEKNSHRRNTVDSAYIYG